MTVKEMYDSIGGNYSEALGRLMKDALIEKFIKKFLADGSYTQLKTALEGGDTAEAFRGAHTLKGVTQNLAFAKLSKSSSACCEALRAGDLEKGRELFAAVECDYNEVINAINAVG